jgi:hypothetical protein
MLGARNSDPQGFGYKFLLMLLVERGGKKHKVKQGLLDTFGFDCGLKLNKGRINFDCSLLMSSTVL